MTTAAAAQPMNLDKKFVTVDPKILAAINAATAKIYPDQPSLQFDEDTLVAINNHAVNDAAFDMNYKIKIGYSNQNVSPFDLKAALNGNAGIFRITNPLAAPIRGQGSRHMYVCSKTFTRLLKGLNAARADVDKLGHSADVERQHNAFIFMEATIKLLKAFFAPYTAFLAGNDLADACVIFKSASKSKVWADANMDRLGLDYLKPSMAIKKWALIDLYKDPVNVKRGNQSAQYIRNPKRIGSAARNLINTSRYTKGDKADSCYTAGYIGKMVRYGKFLKAKRVKPGHRTLAEAQLLGGRSYQGLRRQLGSTRKYKKSSIRYQCRPNAGKGSEGFSAIHGRGSATGKRSQRFLLDNIAKMGNTDTALAFNELVAKNAYAPRKVMPYADGGARALQRDAFWRTLYKQNKTGQYARNKYVLTPAEKLQVHLASAGNKRALRKHLGQANAKSNLKGDKYRNAQQKVPGKGYIDWVTFNKSGTKHTDLKRQKSITDFRNKYKSGRWDQSNQRAGGTKLTNQV